MDNWHNLHITDKGGKEYFKTTASPSSTQSEINNLKAHIDNAKRHPEKYSFLDAETACVVLDGTPLTLSRFDFDLLDELMK